MDRDELLALLTGLQDAADIELAHVEADCALLDYINDEEIRRAFATVPRWYA